MKKQSDVEVLNHSDWYPRNDTEEDVCYGVYDLFNLS